MDQPTSQIRDMHVIVDRDGERRPMKIAAELAARVGAHLTGIAIAFEPSVPVYAMPAAIPTDLVIAARERALSDADRAKAAFEKTASATGISYESRTQESVGGERLASIADTLALSDLAVVGQHDPDHPEPLRNALIEAILFHARAPALIIPYAGVTALKTGKAVVAWDGRGTAAAAVRAALPLLSLADTVQVVMVEESRKSELPGADIATFLARHGLTVDTRTISDATGDIAASILNYTADEAADWLVMGAYGHSRLREFLLGGTTREILQSMTLPVLMAH